MLDSLQSLHSKFDSIPQKQKLPFTAPTSRTSKVIINPPHPHDRSRRKSDAYLTYQNTIQSTSVPYHKIVEAEKPMAGSLVHLNHFKKVNPSIRMNLETLPNKARAASPSRGLVLSCLDDCPCRCHRRKRLRSPHALSNYIGDATMYLSNLPWCFSSITECDEQTCRRSAAIEAVVRYTLPKWFSFIVATFNANIMLKGLPIQLGIESPRIVPYCSPIFKFIEHGDLGGLQNLMITHKTSVCDVDPYGLGLLYVSNPSNPSLFS